MAHALEYACEFPPRNRHIPAEYRKHATAKVIKNAIGDRFETYFKFAFVRHPLDRLVSLYHWGRQISKTFDWEKHDSFEHWFEECFVPERWFEKWGPQIELLTVDGELAMDFIGRFENLEVDWQYACKHLSIDACLPRVWGTKRASWRTYYSSPSVVRAAIDIYKADIAAFDFTEVLSGSSREGAGA